MRSVLYINIYQRGNAAQTINREKYINWAFEQVQNVFVFKFFASFFPFNLSHLPKNLKNTRQVNWKVCQVDVYYVGFGPNF